MEKNWLIDREYLFICRSGAARIFAFIFSKSNLLPRCNFYYFEGPRCSHLFEWSSLRNMSTDISTHSDLNLLRSQPIEMSTDISITNYFWLRFTCNYLNHFTWTNRYVNVYSFFFIANWPAVNATKNSFVSANNKTEASTVDATDGATIYATYDAADSATIHATKWSTIHATDDAADSATIYATKWSTIYSIIDAADSATIKTANETTIDATDNKANM